MADSRLTWRNVAAPDFSGVAYSQRNALDALGRAVSGITGMTERRRQDEVNAASNALVRDLLQYNDSASLNAAIQGGLGANTNDLSLGAINTMGGRADALFGRELAQQNALNQERINAAARNAVIAGSQGQPIDPRTLNVPGATGEQVAATLSNARGAQGSYNTLVDTETNREAARQQEATTQALFNRAAENPNLTPEEIRDTFISQARTPQQVSQVNKAFEGFGSLGVGRDTKASELSPTQITSNSGIDSANAAIKQIEQSGDLELYNENKKASEMGIWAYVGDSFGKKDATINDIPKDDIDDITSIYEQIKGNGGTMVDAAVAHKRSKLSTSDRVAINPARLTDWMGFSNSPKVTEAIRIANEWRNNPGRVNLAKTQSTIDQLKNELKEAQAQRDVLNSRRATDITVFDKEARKNKINELSKTINDLNKRINDIPQRR